MCVGYDIIMLMRELREARIDDMLCYYDEHDTNARNYLSKNANDWHVSRAFFGMVFTRSVKKCRNNVIKNVDKLIHAYFGVNFDIILLLILSSNDDNCALSNYQWIKDITWTIIRFIYKS